jgi:hypothetical protein
VQVSKSNSPTHHAIDGQVAYQRCWGVDLLVHTLVHRQAVLWIKRLACDVNEGTDVEGTSHFTIGFHNQVIPGLVPFDYLSLDGISGMVLSRN